MGPSPATTVGEHIEGIILKELWCAQLLSQPELVDFDPAPSRALVEHFAPSIARDVLDAVRGWIPIAADLTPASLLPDLDQFPDSPQDEDGLTVWQRSIVHGASEIVLDIFNDPGAAPNGCPTEMISPVLPRSSLAAVAVQIAAMLEHLSLLHPQGAQAQLQGSDLDLAAWQHLCTFRGEQPLAGTKQQLVEELQQCRRQIFDLEKELVTQVKVAEAASSREKQECDKTVGRLLCLNAALEEKLKQRTEQYRCSSTRIETLQRQVQHEHLLVEEKSKKVRALEDELSKSGRMQADLLEREREYGNRILKLRMEEYEGMCEDHKRRKHLESVLKGESSDHDTLPVPRKEDLKGLAEETLDGLLSEFATFFEDRQNNLLDLTHQCEDAINEKRRTTQIINEDMQLQMSSFRSRKDASFVVRNSVGVQVELGPRMAEEVPRCGEAQDHHSPSLRPSGHHRTDRAEMHARKSHSRDSKINQETHRFAKQCSKSKMLPHANTFNSEAVLQRACSDVHEGGEGHDEEPLCTRTQFKSSLGVDDAGEVGDSLGSEAEHSEEGAGEQKDKLPSLLPRPPSPSACPAHHPRRNFRLDSARPEPLRMSLKDHLSTMSHPLRSCTPSTRASSRPDSRASLPYNWQELNPQVRGPSALTHTTPLRPNKALDQEVC